MSWKVITPPVVEPVTLAEVKLQCGYSPNEDADPVKEWILARRLRGFARTARIKVENDLRRALISQTIQKTFDVWPHEAVRKHGGVLLPRPPLVEVTGVQYRDGDGQLQTLDPDNYVVDAGDDTAPGRLRLAAGAGWPLPAVITFVAGYGETGADVPEEIRQAILFLAQFFDENGAATDLPLPRVVSDLISPYINRIC